jgi:hypothetical protein
VVTPGSLGDWMQASVMAAALAGLAASCARALRQEEGGEPRREGVTRVMASRARSRRGTVSAGS